jgi:hypothetical protein
VTGPFSGYQQSSSYTAAQDRQLLASRMAQDTLTGRARDGVIPGSAQFVTTPTGLMNLSVSGGIAMISNYNAIAPAATALTVAPATATARRDLVILRVKDTEAGDATSGTTVELVKGTVAGSDPAIPARSLVLAQIQVGANVTSINAGNITDRKVWSGAGTPMYVPYAAATNPPVPAGTMMYDSAVGWHYYKAASGQTWNLAPAAPEMFGGPPTFGSISGDPYQTRTIVKRQGGWTDEWGVANVGTPFGSTLFSAWAQNADDAVDCGLMQFLPRLSSVGNAVFFCYKRSNGGAPAVSTFLDIHALMIGY